MFFMLVGCQDDNIEIQASLIPTTPPSSTPIATNTPPKIEPPPIKASFTPVGTDTPTSLPTSTPPLVPGATQVSSLDGMAMIYIPAGEFQMGSMNTDDGRIMMKCLSILCSWMHFGSTKPW
jgi:hypothetical protein